MSRNRNVQRQAALALSAVLIALPVTAQIESPGYTVNATDIDLSWAPTNVPADGKLELTFWEALEVALRRNYGLVIERYNLEESGLRLMENMGIYDLGFTTDLTGFNETTPSNSNLQGAIVQEQEEVRLDFSFSQLNRGGGTTIVDFKNQRFESNSQFAAVNPSFRSDVDLTYRQPLLRNMGKLATTRNLIVARNNLDGGQETFEVQVIEVIRTVGLNYWTLVEAREQILVAEESLRLAEGLHEQNKIRVEVGTLAPLELIQSEAGIATRRDEFIRATIDIGNAEDDLREALNVPQGPLWSVEIIPRTKPDITRIEIDTEQAVADAIKARPEIRRKQLQNDNLDVDWRYRKNQKKPQLDFAATYGFNGQGGDIKLVDFFTGELVAEADGDYGDALDQLRSGDFDGWTYALNLSLPVQNRERKAQLTIAELAYERGHAELKQLELQVATEVRKAARTVTTAEALVDSTRVSRRLEQENLKAEGKRYENGMSTSFQVLQIQEDLAEARSNAVKAETGYRKALIEYYRAIGSLDETAGVQIGTDVPTGVD